MTISVYDNNQWKTPKTVYVREANVWTEVKSVSVFLANAGNTYHTVYNTAVISSNVTNANLFTILGSPTRPITAKVTVNTNVWVTSVNANVASFNIGPFPVGSRVYLVNNGTIQGARGNAAWPGGNAISTMTSLIINNNGTLAGGAANTVVSAGPGYYLSGSTITTFENSGTTFGLSG